MGMSGELVSVIAPAWTRLAPCRCRCREEINRSSGGRDDRSEKLLTGPATEVRISSRTGA